MTEDTATPDCLVGLIAPAPTKKKISDRGARFVDEYMLDLNASRAARAAGYKTPGFPNEIAVTEELERRRKEISQSLKVNAERVLREYARVAFLDLRKLFKDDGTPKDFMELDPDVRAAIASMEVETQGESKNWKTVTKYKFVSKLTALEALAKHLQLFPNEKTTPPDPDQANVYDMSDTERARRISHILHSSVKRMERVGSSEGISDAEVVSEQ